MDANNISYDNARYQLAIEAKRIYAGCNEEIRIPACYAMALHNLTKKYL